MPRLRHYPLQLHLQRIKQQRAVFEPRFSVYRNWTHHTQKHANDVSNFFIYDFVINENFNDFEKSRKSQKAL